tara:strand:- start:43 stop:375 length:333 start_codon:yes stop_codon:yes gene_type:complete
MKIELNEKDSKILKKDKTYTLVDNTKLENLVVSKTILHPKKNTNGHNHVGKEEVYHFVSGEGYIRVGDETTDVRGGDIVLIPDGWFHKVWNTSEIEDLIFVCVFEGKRNH